MKTTILDALDQHAWNIQKCLRLTNFEVTVSDTYHNKKQQKDALNSKAAMEVYVDYKYLRAEIWYDKNVAERNWRSNNKNETIKSLIHEICHIIVDELFFEYLNKANLKKEDIANTYREQATEHISRWGWELYYGYMKQYNISYSTGKEIKKRKNKGR